MGRRWEIAWFLLVILLSGARGVWGADPFLGFTLPDAWEERFWAGEGMKALLAMEPEAVAKLVPVQSGLWYCRCPACGAPEGDEPMTWTAAKPEVITCRACAASFPSDAYPAKVPPAPGLPPAVPEEVVEVVPRVFHRYAYHAVEPEKQRVPDERVYLAAKRDALARVFLSKAALYAAVRYHEQAASTRDARLAAVILVRFAQVYPRYAAHVDAPGSAKVLHPATLGPPFRPGFLTARWESLACHEVPVDLAIAYAMLRGDGAIDEAGRLLGEANPRRAIEDNLFRASAEFLRAQPNEASEAGLIACRGLLVAGRLLNDQTLVSEAAAQLDGLAEAGFHHDGMWRVSSTAAQQRVVALVDGWIRPLLAGANGAPVATGHRSDGGSAGSGMLAMADLARAAVGLPLEAQRDRDVRTVAFPAVQAGEVGDGPVLLGGAGMARLRVGSGDERLAIDLLGMAQVEPESEGRLAFELSVGGRRVLGGPETASVELAGWRRASACRNLVLVDGLNQRETVAQLRQPAPASDVRFHAADEHLQVVCFEDRAAYPQSTTLYRHTIVALGGEEYSYAVSLFEVEGGRQHDQMFHAAEGQGAMWRPGVAVEAGPTSLLPMSLARVAGSRVEDGRWFVQALGEIGRLHSAVIDGPAQAVLFDGRGPGVRLHLMGDMPAALVVGEGPGVGAAHGASALVLRRRSDEAGDLKTRFVTVLEPVVPGCAPSLRRVGRLESPEGSVVLALETARGSETIVINTRPYEGRTLTLADRGELRTDALVVHVNDRLIEQAGGSYAELSQARVTVPEHWGTLVSAGREAAARSRGWFQTAGPLEVGDAAVGRTLVVRHGDGSSRGWTIERITSGPEASAHIAVREEPGFTIDPVSGDAVYYQYPRVRVPGPHRFRICLIARGVVGG